MGYFFNYYSQTHISSSNVSWKKGAKFNDKGYNPIGGIFIKKNRKTEFLYDPRKIKF